MSQSHPRHIHFESVPNFRDLGGYRTHDGRTVAWRRLFRSAALHKMNDREMARLKQEVSPRAVIDLRSPQAPERNPEVLLIEEIGARYHHIPFSTWRPGLSKDEAKADLTPTNLGEIYLYRINEKPFGKRLVDALEIIAERDNHPLVLMTDIRARMISDPRAAPDLKDLPDFQWEASAESMTAFLSLLRREYGSADGYLRANGARSSLVDRLKVALLAE